MGYDYDLDELKTVLDEVGMADDVATAVNGVAKGAVNDTFVDVASGVFKVMTTGSRGFFHRTIDAGTRAYLLARGELNWDIFNKGPRIRGMKELQPGDVLLKRGGIDAQKLWKDPWKEGHNLISVAIQGVQLETNRSNHKYVGAGLLTHAAIYCGDGKIAEAIGDGVMITNLNDADNKDFDYHAVRHKTRDTAKKAADISARYASSGKISYSKPGLLSPVIGSTLGDGYQDLTKHERDKLDRGGEAKMFCSEFVIFCYNCMTDDLKLPRIFEKRQDRVTPEELYVHLRDHKDFSYVGALPAGVR